MRARFLLSEVRIGLRRNLTMTFAVVVTTAISLSLLGIGLLSNAQVGAMKDYWYDKIEVSVFLCGNLSDSPSCAAGSVTPEQRLSIQQDLKGMTVVDSVFYESQTQAFTRFQERFKDSAIAQNVTADQLPELAVGLASVLTAALLISNTLRIAAFNRRRETGVMKLVGASSWSIQLPFLLEGVISAVIGWGLATGLLAGLKSVVDSQVAPLLSFTNFFGWGEVWVASGYLLATGLVVSILASVITLRRYLKV